MQKLEHEFAMNTSPKPLKAQLWIGHDKDITARIDRAPKFYE
jgi:hypothetical protein